MRRRILWILFIACVVVWGIAAFLSVPLLSELSADELPTLMVLPSLTPSARPTSTFLPTITSTPTQTFTATNTPGVPTATFTATATSQPGTCSRFVATTGNDANDGLTITTPWKTVQKAATSAQAGNVVCVRGGTYSEVVAINVSGSAGAGYITFQSYPGETAILDGTGKTPSGSQGMFSVIDKSYIKIIGFEIRNFKITNANNVPMGIWVTGASHHI